jgi:hypothetical protein
VFYSRLSTTFLRRFMSLASPSSLVFARLFAICWFFVPGSNFPDMTQLLSFAFLMLSYRYTPVSCCLNGGGECAYDLVSRSIFARVNGFSCDISVAHDTRGFHACCGTTIHGVHPYPNRLLAAHVRRLPCLGHQECVRHCSSALHYSTFRTPLPHPLQTARTFMAQIEGRKCHSTSCHNEALQIELQGSDRRIR